MKKYFYVFMFSVLVCTPMAQSWAEEGNIQVGSGRKAFGQTLKQGAPEDFPGKQEQPPKELRQNLVKTMDTIKLLANEESISEKLSKPKSRFSIPYYLKPKEGVGMAEDVILDYGSLEISLRKYSSGKTDIKSLIIRKNNPKLSLPVQIGATKDSIIQFFGKPDFDDGEEIVYYLPPAAKGFSRAGVCFLYGNDIIKMINFVLCCQWALWPGWTAETQ